MDRRLVLGVLTLALASLLLISLRGEPFEVIQIGVMSSSPRTAQQNHFQAEFAKTEINRYCEEIRAPFRFNFVYTDADSNPDEAKELTKTYSDNGIDIVIGYDYGSYMDASDYEAKQRGMIMVSPSSRMSLHRKIYPHIFQMTPVDIHQNKAIAAALMNIGFEKLVVISETGSGWDYLFMPEFNETYISLGGEIVSQVFTTDPANSYSFNHSLGRAEEAVINSSKTYGDNSLAVLATFNYGHPDTFTHISRYSGLMNVTWFATDWLHIPDMNNYESPNTVLDIKLIHPVIDISPLPNNEIYSALNEAYHTEFGRNLTRYAGNLYDACWITSLSVLDAMSTLNTTFIDTIPRVASNYYGATGECSLDEWGDRLNADYVLYEYQLVDGVITPVELGYYLGSTGKIEWED